MDPAPWTGSKPVRLPFTVPRGRLASWVSGRMPLAVSQQEVAGLLDATPLVRRIALPYRTLSCIEQEPGELCTGVARHETDNLTAFTATR
jgi:hypothetical protein